MRNKALFFVLFLTLLCAMALSIRAGQSSPAPLASSTSSGVPALSDVATLLKQVQKNQDRLEQDRERYSFTEVEEQDSVSRKGQVKAGPVNQYDVFFLHGYLIRRLVKKDGKSLSAAAQKKEDGRVRKLVEKYERKAEKKNKQDESEVGVGVFLRTSLFTHPRWERLGGRRVLAFDFHPNPNYRPQTLVEKMVYCLAGEAWIDAQAREVVRLQAGFDSSYKIAGGLLASIEKGTTVTLAQTFVDGDAWLPSYFSIHARGRLLLFKGVRMNLEDHFSD
ncbi:MAG TPA: hypothetical protein VGY31_02365, partial [Terriglobia bacterium]|nr:hypothetical protein [Terriglobia bacterium]